MSDAADEIKDNFSERSEEEKNSNRLLIGIVIGSVVLMGIALAVVLLQPKQDYLPEDSPEGIAHNYLFALQQGEYQRAYSYLSRTLPGYPPNLEIFTENVEDNTYQFRLDEDTTLRVDSVTINDDKATVLMNETIFYSEGIFTSGDYTSDFKIKLQLEDSGWKITGSGKYFARCWDFEGGCH